MNRFITSFNSSALPKAEADVVIVGAGITGMYVALMLPEELEVIILSKGGLEDMNSYYAQGGIAAPIDERYDSPEKHYNDTLSCGRYFNLSEAVSILVNEAKDNIERLIELGIEFDCNEEGRFALGKEGGHALARVLHIGGDKTGELMSLTLRDRLLERSNITLVEDCFVIDLLTKDNSCYGVLAEVNKNRMIYHSKYTVMATGGIGQLYDRTTNAKGIQGDGIAMAIRAGAHVKDLDLVQFHPTAFYTKAGNKEQTFLISEAVRGEGAILLNEKKEPFMENLHPLKDLAPRDIVSEAISRQIRQGEEACVYLDITHHSKAFLEKRFPTIYQYCQQQGVRMEEELIPVAPVAHYFMGGIDVDLYGRTSIDNLYACGECACTGVHGKNRLASNSLLEAVVFGDRVAGSIGIAARNTALKTMPSFEYNIQAITIDANLDQTIRKYMMEHFGVIREEAYCIGFKQLIDNLWEEYRGYGGYNIEEIGIMNKLLLAKSILKDYSQMRRIKVC